MPSALRVQLDQDSYRQSSPTMLSSLKILVTGLSLKKYWLELGTQNLHGVASCLSRFLFNHGTFTTVSPRSVLGLLFYMFPYPAAFMGSAYWANSGFDEPAAAHPDFPELIVFAVHVTPALVLPVAEEQSIAHTRNDSGRLNWTYQHCSRPAEIDSRLWLYMYSLSKFELFN